MNKFKRSRLVVTANLNFVICSIVCYVPPHLLSLLYILSIISLASKSLAFTYLMHYIFYLISHFYIFYILCLLLYLWSCIVCIAFLVLFLALCLMHCVCCYVLHLLDFRFHSSAINLLVFSLYIVGLDKQLYVELTVNQYRYLFWHC